MRKTSLLFGFIFTLCLISCNFNKTSINRKSDKIDAEKVTDELYSYIKKKDFTRAEKLFSDQFYAVTNRAGLHDIFQKTNKTLGDYEGRELLDWKTNIIVGTNSKSEYFFVYEVKYQKFKAKETIVMFKEDDGVIRIVSYNVSSDGFSKSELQK